MAIYLHDWAEKDYDGREGVERLKYDFSITDEELSGVEILLASYTYESYSGEAFVLFRKNGKLFEVNGMHCSCCGLEGQWEPDEVLLEELRQRVENGFGSKYYNEFNAELKAILDTLM